MVIQDPARHLFLNISEKFSSRYVRRVACRIDIFTAWCSAYFFEFATNQLFRKNPGILTTVLLKSLRWHFFSADQKIMNK